MLVGGTVALLRDRPVSVDEVFWKSVQDARKDALRHEREVRLRFVDDKDKGKEFVVEDGEQVKEFPIPAATAPAGSDLDVQFFTAMKGGPSILVAGQLMESNPIKYVRFFSDGTCTPFHVQIARNGGVHKLSIDPWTCAEELNVDPNAPK